MVNNVQLQCSGTTLTKPLMCWSLLDWLIAIPVIVIGAALLIGIIAWIYGFVKGINE